MAIVLGPASALCDRLSPRGDLYDVRKGALEMGGEGYGCALAAAFRLPRGLWREAHRQNLGVWVLQGATAANGVVVADLSGTEIEAGELAADVLGALGRTGARSYRYGRVIPYNDVWTRDTVVLPGIGTQQSPSARVVASAHDRLVAATLVTREPIDGFDLTELTRGSTAVSETRSLGELVDGGGIRLQSGSRIADEETDPTGSLRILSATNAARELWIDPLVAADRYAHAARTERGDVVFAANPTPRAMVDEIGGALVASPSRILRLDPLLAGIGPRALAAAINDLPATTEWRAWPIPRVPTSQIGNLEDALGRIADHHAAVRKHEAAAAELTASLIQGVVAGSVTLGAPSTKKMKAG